MYRPLAEAIEPRWEVVAIEAPGRGGAPGPLPADFGALCAAQEKAVLAAARPPYVLFGHSLGGWVAFRIAQRLARSPRAPAALALSGCRPPGHPDPWCRARLPTTDELIDFLVRVGGTDERLLANPEFVSYALPQLRSDLRAGETVTPLDGSVPVPAVLLAGASDPLAPRAVVEAWCAHLPRAAGGRESRAATCSSFSPTETAALLDRPRPPLDRASVVGSALRVAARAALGRGPLSRVRPDPGGCGSTARRCGGRSGRPSRCRTGGPFRARSPPPASAG